MTDDPNPKPKHLIPFLKAYLEWAEAGAPEHEYFDRRFGLCCNYDEYAEHVDGQISHPNFYSWLPEFFGVVKEIDDDGLPLYDEYPFRLNANNPWERDYTKNPRRMEWVRKMIEEYGND